MDGATWAAITVIAVATVGGARLAVALRRSPNTALRLAAAALVAVVLVDLGPDVVRDVAEAGSGQWLVGTVCVAGFGTAAVAARWACACGTHPAAATGLAVAAHRALEGAAVALVGSAGMVTALVLHAAGEGFAVGTLGARRRGGARRLLVLACVSPAVGAAALGGVHLPAPAAPIVTAAVAGALTAGSARMLTLTSRDLALRLPA